MLPFCSHKHSSVHSQTVSQANIQSQTFACTTVLVYFLFPHTIDVITAQQKEPADSQKVLFLFVLYLLSHLTQWVIDWQLSLDIWLKGKATRLTSSCRWRGGKRPREYWSEWQMSSLLALSFSVINCDTGPKHPLLIKPSFNYYLLLRSSH